ncbi:hypothetical protein RR45_GL000720 [Lactococcus chungangensis CAU 28 = DSM 22330]|uniref:Uncharacterized protein n=1 Tax=Pseudolactococcus chungangensis CAU 28 = DSM 22330 TaxID=1122154 RepID=A0A1K2H8F1_9LACT|nr:hypothetical protein [Lactococcus chungangensis]PCS02012.1 hypothetical protein RR45_GL000720 [Lactococcus chungangensis CAU 28 = DSM 22330]SFZ72980.1 hypothetical protein SAMN02746068_00712 [Lactococcus chungangensis CAU 28 = DSM 22330]
MKINKKIIVISASTVIIILLIIGLLFLNGNKSRQASDTFGKNITSAKKLSTNASNFKSNSSSSSSCKGPDTSQTSDTANTSAKLAEELEKEKQAVDVQANQEQAAREQEIKDKYDAESKRQEDEAMRISQENLKREQDKERTEQENQQKLEAAKQTVRDHFAELNKNSPGKFPADMVEHAIQETFKFVNFSNTEVLGSADEQIANKTQTAIDIITAGGW